MEFEKVEGIDSLIEEVVPRSFEGFDFGKVKWGLDVRAVDRGVAGPIWDLLDRGGKRWRPFLMKLCYEAVGGKGELGSILALPEVIHNGTLMIDDVEDGSDLRRGRDCVHKIYGNDIAINAGNAMYFLPMYFLRKSGFNDELRLKVFEVVNEEMMKLHFGQGMDIFWHGGNGIPSENEYLQMCAFKTGTLARMAAKLGGVIGGADEKVVVALGEFAEAIGVAFQIQDDVLNICPGEDWGKDFGDDISEGKRTLILIKALENVCEEDGKDLIGILNLRTKNKVMIGEAISMLQDSGAVEYVQKVARDLVAEAWRKLDGVLDDSDAKDKLKMFSSFVVERLV